MALLLLKLYTFYAIIKNGVKFYINETDRSLRAVKGMR